MINHGLVTRVLDAIEGDLDRWDQEEYVSHCGTRMCFGGWALHLCGYETLVAEPWKHAAGFRNPRDNSLFVNAADIENEAMEVLGFDDDAAYQVFHWQPEDHLPVDANYEVYAARAAQFEAFKAYVLAVTKEDTEA